MLGSEGQHRVAGTSVGIPNPSLSTVMVVLPGLGCPSRHEPARSQGLPIPADNFPNKLTRVCDSAGKSPAWRGLDAAFLSNFVMSTLKGPDPGRHSARVTVTVAGTSGNSPARCQCHGTGTATGRQLFEFPNPKY